MNKPETDFVTRTKEILEKKENNHEVSLLVNCSFGLVVFPYAMLLRKLGVSGRTRGWWSEEPFWKRNLKDCPELPQVIQDNLANNLFPKSTGELFYLLRNSLCHERFDAINKGGKLIGIKLILRTNLTVELEKKELNDVLTFITNVYLEFLAQ